jgi:hypothetical protein
LIGVSLEPGGEATETDVTGAFLVTGALFVSLLLRPGSQIARKTMLATSKAPRNTATRAIDRRDMVILQRNPHFAVKREAEANTKRILGYDLRHLAYRQLEISSPMMLDWSPKSAG